MANIFILEDEEMLRSSMLRGLAKLPGVRVDGAGTLDEALAAIDVSAPDLILSDLDLPGRSGIELIGELSARRLEIPIVYISAYLNAYGSQIPPNARVQILEKPVELQQLRDLVLEYLDPEESKGPEAPPFGAVDYIQLAAMGRHSVRIQLVDVTGGHGEIILRQGEVWCAEDESGSGREALFRLLVVKASSLECGTFSNDAAGPRNVEGRTEELLLEAVRLADEDGRSRQDSDEASLDAAFEQVFSERSEESEKIAPEGQPNEEESSAFSAAMDRGLEAMLKSDHQAAMGAFLDAHKIRPEDRVVETNLARLREMGFGEREGSDA